MIRSVLTLDAALTVGDAIAALEGYADDVGVVVRRRELDTTYYYTMSRAEVLGRMAGSDESSNLRDALGLHETGAAPTLDFSGNISGQAGVVLDGTEVVGVAVPGPGEGPTRGGLFPERPTTGAEPGTGGTAGGDRGDSGGEDLVTYPALDAPEKVAPGEAFDLSIGLSATPTDTHGTGAFRLTMGDEIELVVQVTALGFEAPNGIRQLLTVRRDSPEQTKAVIKLVAPSIDQPTWGLLQVEYARAGAVVARAWREILVADPATAAPRAPVVESSGIPAAPQGPVPDLTVTALTSPDGRRLSWTFTTPHDVPLPNAVVETKLPPGTARNFADQVLRQIPAAEGSPLLDNTITGLGITLADLLPAEFWDVLEGVWQIAGGPPSLLLVSDDTYVPWELASLQEIELAEGLVNQDLPPILGVQVRMGRWLPSAISRRRVGNHPSQPPAAEREVARFALVIGDYLDGSGVRPLPKAKEEGKALAAKYPNVWRAATAADLDELLEDRLTEQGDHVSVQVIHIACHGAVDPVNTRYNGIVLADSDLRLDQLGVTGSKLVASQEPFVFLNGCELGLGSEVLGTPGGLAPAFLGSGSRGFIAPLWLVDDTLAHDLALEFYEMTIGEGIAAGEALRRMRQHYDPKATKPLSTPLAYVFYGHPDLRLALAS